MWSGSLDPGYALALAEQLKLNPQSRTRAMWLGSIEYLGWTPEQFALANIYDLIGAALYGMANKRMPEKDRYPRPAPPPQKAATIADFNVELFMRQLSG